MFIFDLGANVLVLGIGFRLLEIDGEVNFFERWERLLIARIQNDDSVELPNRKEMNDRGDLLLGHLWRDNKRLQFESGQEELYSVRLNYIVHINY